MIVLTCKCERSTRPFATMYYILTSAVPQVVKCISPSDIIIIIRTELYTSRRQLLCRYATGLRVYPHGAPRWSSAVAYACPTHAYVRLGHVVFRVCRARVCSSLASVVPVHFRCPRRQSTVVPTVKFTFVVLTILYELYIISYNNDRTLFVKIKNDISHLNGIIIRI